MTERLKGKIALITGAASGIDEATARLFHAHSAQVIIADINDQQGTHIARALGIHPYYQHLDLTQEQEWQHINLDSVFLGCLAAIELMKEKGGVLLIYPCYFKMLCF